METLKPYFTVHPRHRKLKVCSVISLALCCLFWWGIGGSLPTYAYEAGGFILFVGSAIQIFFFLLCLLICKRKIEGKCLFIFVESGLILSIAFASIAFVCLQDFYLDSAHVREYSVDYFKENGQPPPFMNFVQRYVPCCGIKSFDDYCYTEAISGRTPRSSIVLNPSFSVPTSCCSKTAVNCAGQNVDRILLTLIHDIEQKELNDFLANFTNNTNTDADGDEEEGEATMKKYAFDFVTNKFKDTSNSISRTLLINDYDLKYRELCESVIRAKLGQDQLEKLAFVSDVGDHDHSVKNSANSRKKAAVDKVVKELAMKEFFKTMQTFFQLQKTSWIPDINVLGCGIFLERVDIVPLLLFDEFRLFQSPLSTMITYRQEIINGFLSIQLGLTVVTFLILNIVCCIRRICEPPRPLPLRPPPALLLLRLRV